MDKKVFKQSGLPLRRTVELLPEIFRSSSNDKFLSATLDPLIQPGTLDRLNGYIGRNYGRTYNTSDVYLDVAQSLRHAYQFEPGVVIYDENKKPKNLFDYVDLKNQLKFFNNKNERDDLTTGQQHYTWTPPLDLDKFVNYREYYWLPAGPDPVQVLGQEQSVVSSYKVVTEGQNEWLFFPDGLKRNPAITLYRGQTYEFNVNCPGDGFHIRTSDTIDYLTTLLGTPSDYNKGVTNNGIEVGKITFKVPNDAPDMLYYQSGTNINRIGSFRIANVLDNTYLDVEKDIIGKLNYQSSNGVKFTNGLRVEFVGKTSPEIYRKGYWIVEGVGTGIKLINLSDLELPPIPNPYGALVFDDQPFDTEPFDDASTYPSKKDYITINRASLDKNPWSRYNRWFHRSVIEYSAQLNGTTAGLAEDSRAKRPIIEFQTNLQLFNHGSKAKNSVDLIDDFTTDVFSTIEGTAGYNIDNVPLFEGARVLFTADNDNMVNNKIYVVKFVTIQTSTNTVNRKQINLVEADDSETLAGECLIVTKGKTNAGKMYHFDGTVWKKSQEKLAVNQAPLFDIFDSDNVSLSDTQKYVTSSFQGTRLISYKVDPAGVVDKELGFAVSYLNINNTGDILFDFDFETQNFTYQSGPTVVTRNINFGYYRLLKELGSWVHKNSWSLFDEDYCQAVIQTHTFTEVTNTVEFDAVFWDQVTREKILFYLNGDLIKDSYTDTVINDKRTFTFIREFAVNDVLMIKVYSDAEPNLGFYEFPLPLERNPLNEDVAQFTLGQVNDHLRSMVELSRDFSGQFPGISNLRDIDDYLYYGRRFIKHSGVPSISLPLVCDRQINVIKAISYAALEYDKYKSEFLNLAVELPFELDTVKFVDQIIDHISKSKNSNSPFANSDMIGSGAYNSIDYTVEDEGIKVFALSQKFDLSTESLKAVYVYRNNVQLLVGRDYEFDSTFGFVRLLIDLVENDQIQIKEYYTTAFNFMPMTPTKLGLYKKFTPEIYLDDTYLEPTRVIRGHDGSIILAYDDFRDELLLELEKRIYNNIKIQYNPDFLDLDNLLGGYGKTGEFTKAQLDSVLNQEFLRWANPLGIDPYANNYFESENQYTYSFSKATDITRTEKMPAYWRGIYIYLYDTDAPHTRPWEMLGFSEKPTWWEEEYGPAPYTSGNLLLWEDIRDGVIRQGNRAGTHIRFKRPNLLSYLPVDDEGRLLDPVSSGSIINYAIIQPAEAFVFGDIGPAESAWRKSGRYPFALLQAIILLRPLQTVSLNFDRTLLTKNDMDQMVSTSTGKFLSLDEVYQSTLDVTKPKGLVNYVVDYLKSNSVASVELASKFNSDNFKVKLSNKIGGFVDKNQQKYLLDSKSPQSKTSGIFVPSEDYEIFFNVSTPVETVSYSAVIIEKTSSGWKLTGYDTLVSAFTYYHPLTTASDPVFSVGGVSETFVEWTANQYYPSGTLIRYQSKFYRSRQAHTSSENFESSLWVSILSVPIVGSITAINRSKFSKYQPAVLPYNTVFADLQSVVDFLLGYGEYLKDQGMVFESFNTDLQVPNDWETSCKEFMFWTTHNWANGSIISLSPSASAITIEKVGRVADNLLDNFYDYNIQRSDGTKIQPKDIQVYRTFNKFILTPLDSTDGIYFAKINYVTKEHVVVFNDRTVFGDVIFDKAPGYRQERIKVAGFRTTDWDGDYTSPGFIYDDVNIETWKPFTDYRLGDIVQYKQFYYTSLKFQKGSVEFNSNNWERLDNLPQKGLVSNFDYKINQIEDYFELDYIGIDNEQKKLAQHSIGYQQREYLQDIAEDEVTQFRLYQGFIREKGTANSITKIFDKVSAIEADAVVLDEEWAFLVGRLGGIDQSNEIEVSIKKENININPQPVLLDTTGIDIKQYQTSVLVKDSDYKIGSRKFKFPTKYYPINNMSAGYVNPADVDFTVTTLDELYSLDITIFKEGSLVWLTSLPTGWDVYRYTITSILVGKAVAVETGFVSLITNIVHNFKVGDIIGLTNIENLTGFYQVAGVNPKTIIIAVAGTTKEPVIDQSSFCYISTFETVRIDDQSYLTSKKIALLPVGSKIWLDDSGDGYWQVLNRQKQYNPTQISEYGIAFPTGTGASVIYLASRGNTIVGNPGAVVTSGDVTRESAVIVYSQGQGGLIPLQVLVPNSGLQSTYLGSYATVMTTSEDGRWLMIGSPNVSYVPSNYRETFDPNATYQQDDTVLYAGKLWRAVRSIYGDGSTINLNSQDWEPAVIHKANPLGKSIYDINQGYRNQGAIDIFEYSEGQYVLRDTIISPRPGHGEYFASGISIAKVAGIEGTSGDVTLTVTTVDAEGGILGVTASGVSGLNNAIFENISGIDVSEPGSNASFDINRALNRYVVTVRNGGTRYAVGDRIKIVGSRLGGVTPTNDLIVTVNAVNSLGEILGSETYNNVTGIESNLVSEQAVFQISKLRDLYVDVNLTNSGQGYTARSIVSYNGRYYACIRDTRIERGAWDINTTYYPGDIVYYQYNPVLPVGYFKVTAIVTGIAPPDEQYYETHNPILPTDTDFWEPVTGSNFASNALPWRDRAITTGLRVTYTPGTIITIPGTELGGYSPANDLTIRVDAVTSATDTSISDFSFFGTAVPGISWSGIASSGEAQYNDVVGEDISEPGNGAIFTLTRAEGSYSATVGVKGLRYNVGDQIRILGTSIGAVPETYYMAVGAPGSLDDTGRVYLYKFNGIEWTHFQDEGFVGIFDSTKFYPAGTVVWHTNNYYKALSDISPNTETPGVITGDSTVYWEAIDSLNTGMLPVTAATPDDGSTIQTGIKPTDDVENIKIGSSYGYSLSFNADGSKLIIGAPNADSLTFDSYKGVWKSYQIYLKGDTVRRNDSYYTLAADSDKGTIPEGNPSIWSIEYPEEQPRTGAVFIYDRDSNNTYKLSQHIDSVNVNSYLTDSTEISAGDQFGYKILLSSESTNMFVTAPASNFKGVDQGATFVFENKNGTYKLIQKLDSGQLDPNERFGSNICITPDNQTIAISAEGAESYKTTTFDANDTRFDRFVTNFKDSQGKTGKVYVFDKYVGKFVLSEIFDEGLNTNEDFGKSLSASNDSIIVGSPKYLSLDPAFATTRIGRIQKFTKKAGVKPWTVIRQQTNGIDIDKLKNLAIYDAVNNRKIADLDIIDPFKGKILSIADQDIDYKTSYDPAVYSTGTVDNAIDAGQAWMDDNVGKIWWRTSTAKYLDYEQNDFVYKTANWGSLAYGASIDVYEWVETIYRPSEWAAMTGTTAGFEEGISGTPLYPDDSNYSYKQKLDSITGEVLYNVYYYWVRSKNTLPNNSTKTNSAGVIANYIANPTTAGIPFAAITDVDKISLYNLQGSINTDEFLLNIQFYKTDKNINLVHNEYTLLTEGSDEYPVEDIERKWIDSLVGEDILGRSVPDKDLPEKSKYGIANRPRQSMFINRNKAVQITVDYINNILSRYPLADSISYEYLNLTAPLPKSNLNLYDQSFASYKELSTIATAKIKPALLSANIANGKITSVDVIDGGRGYRVPPYVEIDGSGTGAKIKTVINKLGVVTGVIIENSGTKYINARLNVRPFSVLIESDVNSNGYWAIYSWDDKTETFYKTATQAYDTTKFWIPVDYWKSGFSNTSRIKYTIPGLYRESGLTVEIGDLVRVDEYGSGGWAVFETVDPIATDLQNKYRLVGRKNGTIQIVNKFYNTAAESTGYDLTQSYDSNKYDTSFSIEFRNILKAVKENIFIDELSNEWNKLFFVSIHYIFSEQLYVDWAFKTSFLNATHNVGYFSNRINYKSDNLSSYQKYIEEVKPYRTKIRKYTSRYLGQELASSPISDFDLPPVFDINSQSIVPVDSTRLEIDQYPWKFWKDNHAFVVKDIVLTYSGKNYTSVPKVVIEGGGGNGAEAQAFVSSGVVTHIRMIKHGSGYTSAPTVTLVGGVGTVIENSAKAVAIIGQSKARTFDMSIKFDRYSKTPKFKNLGNNFLETESFVCPGTKNTFTLKYPPTTDKSKIAVFLKHPNTAAGTDGAKLLNSQYLIKIFKTNISGTEVLTGQLLLNAAPPQGATVTVHYEKNDEILDALNRIDKYYQPTSGMLGVEKNTIDGEIISDYSQLVTGIDFGGVIVQGSMFDVGAGWDAVPWGLEGWDSSGDMNTDFYVAADGVNRTFYLPEPPPLGKEITIYLRKKLEYNSVRLDDPFFDYYDGSTIQINGLKEAPEHAVMQTFVGDGSTIAVTIPPGVQIDKDDTLIFRPIESDGTVALVGRNIDTAISGGDLTNIGGAYSTATGKTASEIVLDGQKFISPEQVPAPEENVPGQVLDTLSIKVFHTDRAGAPALLTRIYFGDGQTDLYEIGQKVTERKSVTVYVDKVKKDNGLDYTISFETNQVRFVGVLPPAGSTIEVVSMALGGTEILDYKEFIADGLTRYYLTGASYFETGSIYATVDGQIVDAGFVNSKGQVNDLDQTLVEFGNPPEVNRKISIVVLSAESGSYSPLIKVNDQTITVTDIVQRIYPLESFINLGGSPTSNVLVERNGNLLTTVDTVIEIYSGNDSIKIGLDPFRNPGDIIDSQVKVFVNDNLLIFGIDYGFTAEDNTVTLFGKYDIGDIIRIEDYSNSNYEIKNNNIVFRTDLNLQLGDVLNVKWFEQYTTMDLTRDIFKGGELAYSLEKPVLGVSYVWVYVNGERATQDIDYYLSRNRNEIIFNPSFITTSTDVVEIISGSDMIYREPVSFEIFKDVLNKNYYSRYSLSNIKLVENLNYYDESMTLTDATALPVPKFDQPGIVTIGGEKIQYLAIDGNRLTGLRRGMFGTSVTPLFSAGTEVVITGYTEAIPYKDSQEKEDFVSDGTSLLIGPLTFIPAKSAVDGTGYRKEWPVDSIPEEYGPCDTIEVFVAGRRLNKDPVYVYDQTVGSHSPAGDVLVEAEFSVDGSTPYIRLTSAVEAATRITVVKRTGKLWYDVGNSSATTGEGLSNSKTSIVTFLQQKTTNLP